MSEHSDHPISTIRLAMFGTTDMSKLKVIQDVLDAVESEAIFTPESASPDERKRKPYDREQLLSCFTEKHNK